MKKSAARRIGWEVTGYTLVSIAGMLAAGSAASAQDAPAPSPQEQSDQQPKGGLETVMVSAARKTEERAIDTPVALTAMSEAQIQRYNTVNLTQLSTQMPGVKIFAAGGGNAGGNMTIRGIGNIATDYGAEQPVALVIDGFSFTRGHIIDVGFFDVADLEVLKGPQSLYFGKNSPAGVVAVTSKSPGDEFEGYARLGYEFLQRDPTVEFGVSIPISDKLKIRVAGKGEFMQGGYIKNDAEPVIPNPSELAGQGGPSTGPSFKEYPKEHQGVGRVTMVFTPTDNFDATLKVFGSVSHQDDIAATTLYACADGVGSHPYLNTGAGLIVDPNQTCGDKLKWTVNHALPPAAVQQADAAFNGGNDKFFQQSKNFLSTLEMNYRVGDITITSVTGFWDYKQREYTNYDYSDYGVVQSLQGEAGHSVTQELRVRSNFDGPLNFMMGGFYENSYRNLDAPVQLFPFGPAPAGAGFPSQYVGTYLTYHQHWDNWIESWSVFGEMTWKILPTLEMQAGIRYTEDHRHSTGVQLFNRLDSFYPDGVGNPFAPTGTVFNLERSFHNTSPSVTLSWHPTDDLMVYAAYKTGFQAAGISNPGTLGNYTQAQASQSLTFDGSVVKGFEAGVKGQLFDRLTFDADVFRYKYSGLQAAVYNPIVVSFTVQNAAGAIDKGIEGNFTYQATEELGFRFGAEYSDLKFSHFTDAQCYAGQNDPTAATYRANLGPLCTLRATGEFAQDMSGQHYGGAPVTITGGFTWDHPITNDWNVSLSGDVSWFDHGYANYREPGTAVPAYALINLSAKVYQPGGPWEVALICSNCADKVYVNYIQDKSLSATGDLLGYLGTPRLITLQTTYRW